MTEGEELRRQCTGARRGFLDLAHVVASRIVPLDIGEQEVRVPIDGRQQVVEVVRNPTRQPSHRFQERLRREWERDRERRERDAVYRSRVNSDSRERDR